jgi:hypothetical protein
MMIFWSARISLTPVELEKVEGTFLQRGVQEKLKSWLTLSFVTKIRMQKILVILRLY